MTPVIAAWLMAIDCRIATPWAPPPPAATAWAWRAGEAGSDANWVNRAG